MLGDKNGDYEFIYEFRLIVYSTLIGNSYNSCYTDYHPALGIIVAAV